MARPDVAQIPLQPLAIGIARPPLETMLRAQLDVARFLIASMADVNRRPPPPGRFRPSVHQAYQCGPSRRGRADNHHRLRADLGRFLQRFSSRPRTGNSPAVGRPLEPPKFMYESQLVHALHTRP